MPTPIEELEAVLREHNGNSHGYTALAVMAWFEQRVVPANKKLNTVNSLEREGTSKAIGYNQCRKEILSRIRRG